jgi:hypothetical protein
MSAAPTAVGSPVVAVLTGDIIGSTLLSVEQMSQTRKVLEQSVRMSPRPGRVICGVPEFFRGDSWQLLVREPRSALRVALTIRAQLIAQLEVGTRLSIGIGTSLHIDPRRVSLSTGEAFALSGRALDAMTGYFDLTGALPDRAGQLTRWLPALLHVVSTVARAWTRRQAQIVSLALLPDNPTHEWIAKSLSPPVAKQTVSESLAGAGWRALLEAIRAFEDTDWASLLGPTETGE